MGQEFVIKSTLLEDKINQLLPSQGGQAAGVDLSASTTIIPIVDLTESASGNVLREDLQKALAHGNVTNFSITNTTSTIVNTTGFYRVFGTSSVLTNNTATRSCKIFISDGTTSKNVFQHVVLDTGFDQNTVILYDFIAKLEAGDSLQGVCTLKCNLEGAVRQIADINGNLS